MVEKLVPDPFKNLNWAYLWINSLKSYIVCFYCMPSWGLSIYFETTLQAACFYLILSFFSKWKEVWNYSSCLIFYIGFEKKLFLLWYSINWPSFIVWLSLLREILGNLSISIVCWPGCDVMNFEINLVYIIKPFFLHSQKVMTKT